MITLFDKSVDQMRFVYDFDFCRKTHYHIDVMKKLRKHDILATMHEADYWTGPDDRNVTILAYTDNWIKKLYCRRLGAEYRKDDIK